MTRLRPSLATVLAEQVKLPAKAPPLVYSLKNTLPVVEAGGVHHGPNQGCPVPPKLGVTPGAVGVDAPAGGPTVGDVPSTLSGAPAWATAGGADALLCRTTIVSADWAACIL